MIRYTKDEKTEEKTAKEVIAIIKRYCQMEKIKKRQQWFDNITKKWN